MKIAILGSGHVGATLGKAWAARGHEITFGVRDPKGHKAQDAVKATGGKAHALSPKEAATAAEVVVLATPWANTQDAVRSAGEFAGKVVVDATNPLAEDFTSLALGHTTSAAEEVARWAKGGRVVKCFNTIGAEHMATPKVAGQSATMFLCGDDAAAKKTAERLAKELGFDALDAGPLRQARLLEPLAMLWISLAFQQKLGTGIAFKLLRGPAAEGHTLYISHSVWRDRAAFEDWTRSEHFRHAHAGAGERRAMYLGPPQLELFESVVEG